MNHWWQELINGNSFQDWMIALGIIVVGGIILYALKKVVVGNLKKWASKTATTIDDVIVAGIEHSVIPVVYVFVIFAAIFYLTIPEVVSNKLKIVFWIVIMFYILRSVTAVVRHLIFGKIEGKEDSDARKKQANGLVLIINITIWIVGFVFLLDNMGYNIGTLIAGLGIGGIAIALAAQTILGDLFSYFIIYFDKPFEIGDFITFDDEAGVVGYIGLKTTRINTLSGEQLICSNKDLTDSRVHNFGRMLKRRVVFKLGVVHQTPAEIVKEIPGMVESIIREDQDVTYDRGHFMNFGNTSLDFEFVFYIPSSDYTVYMNKQQRIFLSILDTFQKKNIKLAHPIQTVFLEDKTKDDAALSMEKNIKEDLDPYKN